MSVERLPQTWDEVPADVKAGKVDIEQLVIRSKGGDRNAMISLCWSIARGVLFRVSRYLSNPMDAEDVSQEILIRVCEKIHTLKEPKAFQGWLNTMIINETRNYVTKSSKRSSIINLEEYAESSNDEDEELLPDDYAVKEEDRKAVMEIIDSLPSRQKEVIILCYYDNMSVNEIASIMNVSQPAVSRYLKLAREKIRKEIQRNYDKSESLYSLSALSIGSILSQVLGQEANHMAPLTGAWFEQALNRRLLAGTLKVRSLAAPLGFVQTTAVALVTSLVVAAGLWVGGVFQNPRSFFVPQPEILEVSGEIIFEGESGKEHINPTHASAVAQNERGMLRVNSWWVTASGSGIILYSGIGDSADTAINSLRANGQSGTFNLYYLMEDSEGITYTLSRQFKLR